MTWTPPRDYENRPITILGAGVLGRRIACSWVAAGYDVHVRDPSAEQCDACVQYFNQAHQIYEQKTHSTKTGTIKTFQDLEPALTNSWLVIEAVPEKIDLKISTFAALEVSAPPDAILTSNSSSYKTSEMLGSVSEATKSRILNTHYYMPPNIMVVELMTCGHTDPAIFPFLVSQLKATGAQPYVARKESTGFIFNRLWAAVKRETLMILSEGVSTAEEIDEIWAEMFIKGKSLPCVMMDQVGLDTVAFIEQHYVKERGLDTTHTVDYLQREYLDQGKLGNKSEKGGLYAAGAAKHSHS